MVGPFSCAAVARVARGSPFRAILIDAMLPRARRVSKTIFPLILRRGAVRHSPVLSLRFLVGTSAPFKAKFSVIVSNKVSKSAVERNLWKRRSRAAICKFENQVKDNYYCLLYLKPEIKTLSFGQLSEKIKDIFYQAKLFVLKP